MAASSMAQTGAGLGSRSAHGMTARHEPCARANEHLQQIAGMRLVAIGAQLVVVMLAAGLLGIDLPVPEMLCVLAVLGAFNVWTWRRVREARPVADAELACQLSVDLLALTFMLGLSGGAANPFVGLFLLPVALGASFLSKRSAWTLAAASVLCFTLLLFVSRPLALPAGDEAHALLGLATWFSYVVTAVVIVAVLMRIASALRRGEAVIASAERKAINDEHILRIGALAAGAAHELGSPLCSVSMLVRELQLTHGGQPELDRSLETMSRQLASCRETLATLLSYGNSTFTSRIDRMPFDEFMRGCVEAFAARRPESTVAFQVDNAGKAPRLLANRALRQALTSLLDNAADVSPQAIRVAIGWDDEWLRVRITDRGPGLSPDVAEGLGKLFFTTKDRGKGSGLGLYLANFVVLRFGGSLAFSNAEGGGAQVEILLPVSKMSSIDMELWRAR